MVEEKEEEEGVMNKQISRMEGMKCEISTGGGRRNGDRRETKERKKKSCPALPQKIFVLCWFRFLSIILRFYMPTPTHHLYSKSPAPAACSMQVSATCVGCRMKRDAYL